MPIELNGSTGISTPGLASANMPTSGGDAIVESGSNSDGEWTRWADGTQEERIKRPQLNSSTNVSDLSSVWDFPQGFVDTNYSLSYMFVTESDGDSSESWANTTAVARSQIGQLAYGNLSTALAAIRVSRITGFTNFSPGDYLQVSVTANGRWK